MLEPSSNRALQRTAPEDASKIVTRGMEDLAGAAVTLREGNTHGIA
jgi:hypothetical protein